MTQMPSPETLQRLADIVGPKSIIINASDQAPYLKEWRGLWHGNTPMVLRPQTTEEVSRILTVAHETGTTIVPQSGNTGLVGGQIPFGGEVLLSLDRMNRILAVDAVDFTITAEAGATLKSIQDAAEKVDRLFPLSLASEGTCRIGGNLATNAGGVNVLAYGNARDLCLGLEVVLADGRILNQLKTLRKDNTGYDLKNLFIGSEGTLGIITKATLKLFPQPRRYDTVFAAVPSIQSALDLLAQAKQGSGNRVIAFELLPEIGIQFTVKHMNTRRALETVSPWYVLFEMADSTEIATQTMLETAFEQSLMTDAVVAQNQSQRAELWALRENMSESQKFEGGSIKHDVAVPVSALPQFIAEASTALETFMPGTRLCCFGHMGDGNMHFNVSQPIGMDKQAYIEQWHPMNRVIHDTVAKYKGSFSAEHGVGVLKREDMTRYKSEIELDVMRSMKQALDPKGILNPGRVLP
jgi:FAD/FMN-containing dehydrogenase